MTARDIYERGFDEDDGKTITATECPDCDARLETNGGETACTDRGLILTDSPLGLGTYPFSQQFIVQHHLSGHRVNFGIDSTRRRRLGATILPSVAPRC